MTSDDAIHHFLCCSPDADTTILSGCANLLKVPNRPNHWRQMTFWFMYQATWWLSSPWSSGPSPHQPSVKFTTIATWICCVILCPTFSATSDVTLTHRMGLPAQQGCLEYSQLELLFSYVSLEPSHFSCLVPTASLEWDPLFPACLLSPFFAVYCAAYSPAVYPINTQKFALAVWTCKTLHAYFWWLFVLGSI